MDNQVVSAKVELVGWWSPDPLRRKSALVKGDLVAIQNKIRSLLASYCTIDMGRLPHVEVTDASHPGDQTAYNDINGRQIDIGCLRNWIVTQNAIMIDLGKNVYGKDVHFTMVYANNLSLVPRNVFLWAFATAVREFIYN